MSLTEGPTPVDDPEVCLVPVRDVQLWTDKSEEIRARTSIVAVSSLYDRIFVGGPRCLVSASISWLESQDEESPERLKEHPIEQINKIVVPLPSTPDHLALSADELTLAVSCVSESGSVVIYMIDSRAFLTGDVRPFTKMEPLNPPGVSVSQLAWNPVLNSMLAVVYSNGAMALLMINAERPQATPDCVTLPPAEGILCVSWSPKGKQLVAGRRGGVLTQYKPDLKEAKTIAAPNIPDSTLNANSVLWLSTYQFLVLYLIRKGSETQPNLFVVNSSKTGETNYVNYDDICYCSGQIDETFYYFNIIPDWGLVFCSSDDAVESTALLSSGAQWTQLLFESSVQALLPRNNTADCDRFPAGMALFLGSSRRLRDSEARELAPSPLLYLVSSDGILRGYYVLNKKSNTPTVTKASVPLTQEGMRAGVIDLPKPRIETAPRGMPIKNVDEMSTPVVETSARTPQAVVTPSQSIGEAAKTLVKSEAKKEVPTQLKPKPEVTPADETHLVLSAIKTEMDDFEKQLLNFRTSARTLSVEIGTEDEKSRLRLLSDDVSGMCKSLSALTATQSDEVDSLQTSMLELQAWTSEAKSRLLRETDSRNKALLKARSLDPFSQRALNRLESGIARMEQQIFELNRMLDVQWKDVAQGRKDKPHTASSIQEALLLNHQIASVQKRQVNKLVQGVLALRKGHFGRDLSTLMESLRVESSEVADLSQSFGPKLQLQSSTPSKTPMCSPIKALTGEKGNALREYLSSRGTVRVTSTLQQKTSTVGRGTRHGDGKMSSQSSSSQLLAELKEKENKKKETTQKESVGTDSVVRKLTFADSSKTTTLSSTPIKQSQRVVPDQKFQDNLQAEKKTVLPSFTAAKSSISSASITSSVPSPTLASSSKPAPTQRITFPSSTSGGATAFSPVGNGSKQAVVNPKLSSLLTAPTTEQIQTIGTSAKPLYPSTENAKSSLANLGQATTAASSSKTSPLAMTLTNKNDPNISSSFGSLPSSKATDTAIGNKSSETPKTTTASPLSSGTTTSLLGALSTGSSGGSTGNLLLGNKTSATAASKDGVLGSPANEAKNSSMFGSLSVTPKTPSTAAPSISAVSSTTATIANKSPTSTAASVTKSATPVAASTAGQTVPSLFGGSTSKTTTTSTPSSLFGTSGSSSIFTSKTNATASPSLFAAPNTTSSTATSFASPKATAESVATTSASTFGAAATAGKASIFGSTTDTTATPLFGSTKTATTASSTTTAAPVTSSPFAATPTTASTSPFAATTTATTSPFAVSTTTQSSPFAATTAASAFSATSTTTGTSLFGSTSTPANVTFGTTTAAATAPFGSPTVSQSAPFGAPTTTATTSSSLGTPTTTAGSVFGSSSSSPFGAVSTAASPFGVANSSGSIFGGTTTASTAFSSSAPTSVFGTAATKASSIFGGGSGGLFGQSNSSNIFGSPSTPSTTAASPFGSNNTQNSGIFGGGNTTGFGASPSSNNVFGSTPATPASTAASTFGNVFGSSNSSATNVFGSPAQTAGPFGSGPAASPSTPFGGSAAASPGFGGPPSFGGSPKPVFGGGATFGGSPSFGGGATFGGSPSFGSGPAPAGDSRTFGSNATFGAMAQQQTGPTFGSLAAQGGSGGSFGGGATSSFGGGATFGGASAFGGGPTFGSVAGNAPADGGSLFGGNASASSPPQSSSFTSWR